MLAVATIFCLSLVFNWFSKITNEAQAQPMHKIGTVLGKRQPFF